MSKPTKIPKSLQCSFGHNAPAPFVYIDGQGREKPCCRGCYETVLKAEYDAVLTEKRIVSIEKAKKERLEKLKSQ